MPHPEFPRELLADHETAPAGSARARDLTARAVDAPAGAGSEPPRGAGGAV